MGQDLPGLWLPSVCRNQGWALQHSGVQGQSRVVLLLQLTLKPLDMSGNRGMGESPESRQHGYYACKDEVEQA